jgi:hypothetical protein
MQPGEQMIHYKLIIHYIILKENTENTATLQTFQIL